MPMRVPVTPSSASPQDSSNDPAADAVVDTCKQRVEDDRREIEDGRIRIESKVHAQPNQEAYNRADLDAPSNRR